MKNIARFTLALFAFALFFASCDNFFSSSWGTPREYDLSNMTVNASNVNEWLDLAVGNPELAEALTKKIIEEMKKVSPGSNAFLILQQAGVRLAVESSGLGEALVSNAAEALSSLDNSNAGMDEVKNILGKVQRDFNSNNGKASADNIAAITGQSLQSGTIYQGGEAPVFNPGFANRVKPEDAVEVVVVLVLGALAETNTNINNLSSENWSEMENLTSGLTLEGSQVVVDPDNPNPTPIGLALAAYLNLMSSDPGGQFQGNSVTSAIRDAFFNS